MTDQPSDSTLPESNITRAGITGKVPKEWKPRRGKRGKGRKLSGEQRHHAGKLQQRGLISSKAAAANGLPGK